MKKKALLVFLHGIGARSRSFQPLIDQLAELRAKFYRDWDTRTVYVFGEKTLMGSKGTYDRLLKDNKNVVVIPNAGHVMQLEQPHATAEICRNYLTAC